jgi:ArsR family transcriptional regulator
MSDFMTPALRPEEPEVVPDRMAEHAQQAADFLKALSHEGRLMILCHLAVGERSVGELESLLGQRQAAVSQQLARLRLEGLVESRRDGKTIFYALKRCERTTRVIELLHELFCTVD